MNYQRLGNKTDYVRVGTWHNGSLALANVHFHPRDGFIKTDFTCYSGLCWHKNWFSDLNRYVSVSRYNN